MQSENTHMVRGQAASSEARMRRAIDLLRAAEVLALESWKDAARAWNDMSETPYQTSSVAEGTSVLVAQSRVRVAARAWAVADRALRGALEQAADRERAEQAAADEERYLADK